MRDFRSNWDSEQKRSEVERSEGWRGLTVSMPFIPFLSGWSVSVIPPFSGATARFRVMRKGGDPAKAVSVYADHFDRLGCVGRPYWEVYPIEDDIERCDLDDIGGLVALIERSLNEVAPTPPKDT